jgi:glutathione peroxidase
MNIMKNTKILLALFCLFSTAAANAAFYDLKAKEVTEDPKSKAIAEVERKFSEYKGKVLLVVNTASECGYTSQYKDLVKTQNAFNTKAKGQFLVLGFPSNDFGGQEPGSDKEIRYFCQSNYQVNFPIFKKDSVTGKSTQPVYQWLKANASSNSEIGWNFEKFLISKSGKVIGRFKSGVNPTDKEITSAIEAALKEG